MVAVHVDYRSPGIEDIAVIRRLRSSSSASDSLVGGPLISVHFSVVNRPGRFNVVADCLSRAFDTAAATSEVHPTFDVRNDVTDDSIYDDGLVQSIFGNLATPWSRHAGYGCSGYVSRL